MMMAGESGSIELRHGLRLHSEWGACAGCGLAVDLLLTPGPIGLHAALVTPIDAKSSAVDFLGKHPRAGYTGYLSDRLGWLCMPMQSSSQQWSLALPQGR